MTTMSARAPSALQAVVSLRSWQLWSQRRPLQAYLVAVEAAFIAALGWVASATHWRLNHLIAFVAVAAVGAAAAETSRRTPVPHGVIVKDLFSVWCLPAAIVLPPVYSMLTPIAALILYSRGSARIVAYRQVFTAAVMGLAYGTCSALFHLASADIGGPRPEENSHAILWILVLAACGVVRWMVNDGAIAIAIKLSEPGASLRSLMADPDSIYTDILGLVLGILLTLAFVTSPALIVLAVPIVPILQRGVGYGQLLSQSRVDGKTGLLNAVTWQREALAELSRATRAGTPSAVMMVDLDHFKAVNDTYGHQAGDEVLASVAAAIRPLLREYDLIGRFGGEEFAVFLPDTTAAEARRAAERIRRHMADLVTPVGSGAKATDVRVTVSIGVAADETSRYDLTEMIAAADDALYHVKESGRNGVKLSSGGLTVEQVAQSEPARRPDTSQPSPA